MANIVSVQSIGIAENGRSFFERNPVFLEIRDGFAIIPREHANVYTVIRSSLQPTHCKFAHPPTRQGDLSILKCARPTST